jgi:hypothetical protein
LEKLLGRAEPRSLGRVGSSDRQGDKISGRSGTGTRDTRRDKEFRLAQESRDFTNKIKIGGEVFDLAVEKGKKIAILTWESLKLARERIDRESLGLYKGMRGVVKVGHWLLLSGEKLDLILKLSPWLSPDLDMEKSWPRNVKFLFVDDGEKILSSLDHVLQVSEWRRGHSELGFVTLYTDGEGLYWFRVSRGFHTALNESLASLESLADELGGETKPKDRERVSSLYRRLQGFFE